MKKIFLIIPVLLLVCISCKQNSTDWQAADSPLSTSWAEEINSDKPWDHYPRPGMERTLWSNLNGLWDFAISDIDEKPEEWKNKIMVPFPVESSLSGVGKRVSEKDLLWYKKEISIPKEWKNNLILLNFEASDWETTLYIDNIEVGSHKGGYDPFYFDISDFVKAGENFEFLISVWDPTDNGTQPRGKQVSNPGGIWYTPSSGIWQTLWLEPVPKTYIKSFRTVSDIDNGTITIAPEIYNSRDDIVVGAKVLLDDKLLAETKLNNQNQLVISLDNIEVWSPESPVLYDLEIDLKIGDKTIDKVSSYTGFRKISLGDSGDGYTRILLNNNFVFQNGPLDQGFWPDGLNTPPTEKAMIHDLEMTKKMGFNMLRKHVKVENRRFYYWCDLMGILVWQDMPSGDKYIHGDMPDIDKSKDDVIQFKAELSALIDTKYNNPSIVIWVPFNEGWGQYDTPGITDFVKSYDTTRLVISTSGWTDRGTGDILDIHHYPDPRMPEPEKDRAIVLGEFGGLGLPVQDHTWEKKNWGYRTMESTEALLEKYEEYYQQVYKFVANGLSAVVYTQTTDVETETNGLLTYDRAIDKMGYKNVARANKGIVPPALTNDARIFTDRYLVDFTTAKKDTRVFYSIDGQEPDESSIEFEKPFEVSETTTLKAFVLDDKIKSRIKTFVLNKVDLQASIKIEDPKPGLAVKVYEGQWTELPVFADEKVQSESIASIVNTEAGSNNDYMGLVFEGYLLIEKDGVYSLALNSDDGSRLILDGSKVIENNGIHGMREIEQYLPLAKGYHSVRIEYFQGVGGLGLQFNISKPNSVKTEVPTSMLYH